MTLPGDVTATAELVRREHLGGILKTIAETSDRGASNAELDSATATSSQWVLRRRLGRLMSLSLVDYKVQLFGEPGRYVVTSLGSKVVQEIG